MVIETRVQGFAAAQMLDATATPTPANMVQGMVQGMVVVVSVCRRRSATIGYRPASLANTTPSRLSAAQHTPGTHRPEGEYSELVEV